LKTKNFNFLSICSKNDLKGSLDFEKGPFKLHIPIKSKNQLREKKERKKRGKLLTYREKIKKKRSL
jgi:hypothetical protein